MNPGVLTPAERRAETVASLFRSVHPHQPPDPTLRFCGNLGFGPGRRVQIVRWDFTDDGVEATHSAVDQAGRTLGVVVRGEDGRYRYSVRGVRLGHAGGVNALSAAKSALAKALGRTA